MLIDVLPKCQTEEQQVERLRETVVEPLSLVSSAYSSYFDGEWSQTGLKIIDTNTDLFHRSTIVGEVKLLEADSERNHVLQDQ